MRDIGEKFVKHVPKLSFLSLAAILLSSGSVIALEGTANRHLAQATDEEGRSVDEAPRDSAPEGDAGETPDKGADGKAERGQRPVRAKEDGKRPARAKDEDAKRPARAKSDDEGKEQPTERRRNRDTEAAPVEEEKQKPAKRRDDPAPTKDEKAATPPKSEPQPAVETPAVVEPPPAQNVDPKEIKPKDAAVPNAEREPRRDPGKMSEDPVAPNAVDPSTDPARAPKESNVPPKQEPATAPPQVDSKAAEPATPPAAPAQVKDIKELKAERKERTEDGGKRVIIEEPDNRVIVKEGTKSIIRADETERFRRLGGNTRREKRDGLDISVNIRPGGIEIFTETDDRGRALRRYRRDRSGREVILFDNRDYYRRHRDGSFIDGIVDLPPPRITIPRSAYIVDYEEASDSDVYDALSAPPIEQIERSYSLEEVRRSPTLRDRMRRIDLDAINFAFGAWDVSPGQYPALERIANAMNRVIKRNPNEMFLLEGHTDAVGSDDDNLSLSDRRAETVAIILTQEFGVPPENITTQGYGEQYLKISTEEAEVQNRRVAVRRITPLMSRAN